MPTSAPVMCGPRTRRLAASDPRTVIIMLYPRTASESVAQEKLRMRTDADFYSLNFLGKNFIFSREPAT